MYLDSQEKIKKPKTEQEVENKDKQIITKAKKSKKKFIFKLLLIIFLFIVIISIGLALFLYLKKWKKEIQDIPEASIIRSNDGIINAEVLTFDSFQKKLDEEKNNSITAVYSMKKDEESIFFNPDKIELPDKSYEIEVLSIKDEDNPGSSTLRNLEDINYKFLSQFNGKIEIRITFSIILISMFSLFKGCNNLLEVDLSRLDGYNLINLNSVFENCDNL